MTTPRPNVSKMPLFGAIVIILLVLYILWLRKALEKTRQLRNAERRGRIRAEVSFLFISNSHFRSRSHSEKKAQKPMISRIKKRFHSFRSEESNHASNKGIS